MNYHKITYSDCTGVATKSETLMLDYITPMDLMIALAKRWCKKNNYKLGGYLGNYCWDATKEV